MYKLIIVFVLLTHYAFGSFFDKLYTNGYYSYGVFDIIHKNDIGNTSDMWINLHSGKNLSEMFKYYSLEDPKTLGEFEKISRKKLGNGKHKMIFTIFKSGGTIGHLNSYRMSKSVWAIWYKGGDLIKSIYNSLPREERKKYSVVKKGRYSLKFLSYMEVDEMLTSYTLLTLYQASMN